MIHGWGAGAGLSRVFLAPWSRSRLKKKKTGAGAAWEKNQDPEPEPLEKSGAGAAKKFAGSPALVLLILHTYLLSIRQ